MFTNGTPMTAGLRPFAGHVIADDGLGPPPAPPFGALTASQRTAMEATDPSSFLRGTSGSVVVAEFEQALTECRRRLDRHLTSGRFMRTAAPALAVVAFGDGPSRAVAIIGDLDVAAFTGTPPQVLPHEQVRKDRVEQLVRYLEVVGLASAPVMVTHRPHPDVAEATAPVMAAPPHFTFRDHDGVDLALWAVTDPSLVGELTTAVASVGRLFLVDGHHRVAAMTRFAPQFGRILTALVPADRLRVLPFHRLLRLDDEEEADAGAVLRRLRAHGLSPAPLDGPCPPTGTGVVTLTVGGTWWSLDLRERKGTHDPVAGLDVRLAEREVVRVLLDDPRPDDDPRVIPVPAPAGLATLERAGTVGIAFAPPDVETILRIAEAGAVLPPKTTYVRPKVPSGLVVSPR